MLMADSPEAITEDEDFAAKALQMARDIEPCGQYHEVMEMLPPTLPGTRWFKIRYLSANGNLSHLIVVFSDNGNVVATYAGVSLFSGGG
jgi:hypothetical protein